MQRPEIVSRSFLRFSTRLSATNTNKKIKIVYYSRSGIFGNNFEQRKISGSFLFFLIIQEKVSKLQEIFIKLLSFQRILVFSGTKYVQNTRCDPIFASITRISICASNHVQISTFHSYIRDTPSNNSFSWKKLKHNDKRESSCLGAGNRKKVADEISFRTSPRN